MSVTFVSKTRIWSLFLIIVVGYGVICGRLFFLHIFGGEYYTESIDKARHNVEFHEACRGNILDCRGEILATTETRVELGVDPQVVREEDFGKIKELAAILEVEESELIEANHEMLRVVQLGDLSSQTIALPL